MPIWWMIPVLGVFVLSLFLSEVVRRFSLRFSVVDEPKDDGKKMHGRAVPLLGGTAIFLSFFSVVLFLLFTSDIFTAGEMTRGHIIGFTIGAFVLILGGFLDDKFDLPARASIAFPIVAALIAVIAGIGVSKVTNPFGGFFEISTWISSVITFVWLLGMMYTTKLLDGVDGLATGIGSIGAAMIAALALSVAYYQPDVALLSLMALAAMLGFLVWNTHPAQIFLGEGGSTLIGYIIGILAVIAGSKFATALLVVGVPLLDVVFVVMVRLRRGKPVWKGGDGLHLHRRLASYGYSTGQIVLIYYVIAILFGLATLLFVSWQKIIALAVLFCLMLLMLRTLSLPLLKKGE
jgi:UDP-GlcNAc:undecaprenyl-phosphate/decaprenyl-phosphate GlcNAc-1-phosphate transferase